MSSPLLQPADLLAVKDLRLAARAIIDGFMSGLHPGNVKGAGLEFSQYRSYQPGDDLRWLDWKMYARSDRFYIRESEMETSIQVRIVIDASNSMRHTDSGISKIAYARYLAAALGYLAHLQGDAAGLAILSEGSLHTLDPRRDAQHMARFYHQLEQLEPGGRFTSPAGYRQLFSGAHTRQLLVVITDYYETEGEITRLLQSLSALGHEILLLHLLGRNELEMDYKGYQAVEDLETGEQVPLDNSAAAADYMKRMQAQLSALRMQLLGKNIDYRQILLHELPYEALRDFLRLRNKRRR